MTAREARRGAWMLAVLLLLMVISDLAMVERAVSIFRALGVIIGVSGAAAGVAIGVRLFQLARARGTRPPLSGLLILLAAVVFTLLNAGYLILYGRWL